MKINLWLNLVSSEVKPTRDGGRWSESEATGSVEGDSRGTVVETILLRDWPGDTTRDPRGGRDVDCSRHPRGSKKREGRGSVVRDVSAEERNYDQLLSCQTYVTYRQLT